jgi:hypothetical protein
MRLWAKACTDSMKMWIDDQLDDPATPNRHPPEGFLGARSTLEAIRLVEQHGIPEFLDLDHDLGGDDRVMAFLRWLADRYPDGPVPKYRCHSENCVGGPAIVSFMSSWLRSLTL